MTYTIAEPCIDVLDRACVDECPVDCIYEGPRMLYIQPDECVDCAACEPVCPVTAIFYEDDVPPEWKQFTPINAEFFSDAVSGLGAPGGAASVGVVAVDHPVVAGWATFKNASAACERWALRQTSVTSRLRETPPTGTAMSRLLAISVTAQRRGSSATPMPISTARLMPSSEGSEIWILIDVWRRS